MPNTFSHIYGDAPAFVRKAWWTGRVVGASYIRADHLRTINDTRGVVDYNIAVGDIVQFDPYSPLPSQAQVSAANATTQAGLNAAIGFGPCVGAPNIGSAYRAAGASAVVTSIADNCVPAPADITASTVVIQPRLYVVTHVHPDVNRISNSTHSNANFAKQRDGGWIDVCPMGVVEALFYKNTDIACPAGALLALYQPATSSASSGVFTYGSTTANTGKPAFTNLLDADLDALVSNATASTHTSANTATIRNIIDSLSRIQAVLAESVDTDANGGGALATTSLRRVALGGGLFNFGV